MTIVLFTHTYKGLTQVDFDMAKDIDTSIFKIIYFVCFFYPFLFFEISFLIFFRFHQVALWASRLEGERALPTPHHQSRSPHSRPHSSSHNHHSSSQQHCWKLHHPSQRHWVVWRERGGCWPDSLHHISGSSS